MMSIRPEAEITSGWWVLDPFTFTLDAWVEVWTTYPLGRAFLNSLLIALFATVLPVLFAPAAAYAFHYLKFPFSKVLLLILVNAFVVPNQVVIIPLFKLWRELGLIDNYLSVVIPFVGLSFAWAVLLVKNFLRNFPRSLIDAAPGRRLRTSAHLFLHRPALTRLPRWPRWRSCNSCGPGMHC